MEKLLLLQETIATWEWGVNIGLLVLALMTRQLSNTKSSWAFIGFLMLIVAVGNASMLVPFGECTSEQLQLASIFGTVVHGALGATFFASWLSDGQT